METLYSKLNTDFYQQDKSAFISELPLDTYTMGFNQQREQYFFSPIDSLTPPARMYGDVAVRAERIMQSFQDRNDTTGVLLDGLKGTGKTMLAKKLSSMCTAMQMPTIIINQPLRGELFNQTIQAIGKPVLIIFDEFEKVYNHEKQQEVLTLLDGTYASKKLVLLTVNDKWGVSSHLLNRPGRILYRLSYGPIGEDIVREYCEEHLRDRTHIGDVIQITKIVGGFTMDMLQAMVQEMNRFNETADQVLNWLNISPDRDTTYKCVVYDSAGKSLHHFYLEENPIYLTKTQSLYIGFEVGNDAEMKSEQCAPSPVANDGAVFTRPSSRVNFELSGQHFIGVDDNGCARFERDGYVILCSPENSHSFNWRKGNKN